ncbi:MAG: hypothetical protein PHW79_04015 [Candidatus Marinimicrobia bacterium]|nr:hypothetical protein [Candidatus Neomarinimicrobiota bacterium]
MIKNSHNVFRLLTVFGIMFAFQTEAQTDSVIQPGKNVGPTISISSRFEFAGDTVVIPIEFGMPLAEISGFQFGL